MAETYGGKTLDEIRQLGGITFVEIGARFGGVKHRFDEWSAIWNNLKNSEPALWGPWAGGSSSYPGVNSNNLFSFQEWASIVIRPDLPLGPLAPGTTVSGWGTVSPDGLSFTVSYPEGTIPQPGPPPTVPAGNQSSAEKQSPAPPDKGTEITPPADPEGPVEKWNFWEWNWFYEQKTGRKGPDAAEVGVEDPAAKITKEEWWAKVKDWYGADGGAAGSGGTGNGAAGSAKGSSFIVFAAAALAALGLIASLK